MTTTPNLISGFASDDVVQGGQVSVTVTNVASAIGPIITVSYTQTNSSNLPQQSFRVQLINVYTGVTVFDSAWLAGTLAMGAVGTFSINLATLNIPLNSGTQFYTATVSSSPGAVASLWYGTGNSILFDIIWGDPSLAWVTPPPTVVDIAENATTTLTVAWAFTDNFPQGFWELVLTSVDGTQIYYDTTLQAGPAQTATLPGINSNTSYLLTLTAYNTNGIAATPITAIFTTGEPVSLSPVTGGFLQRYLALVGYEADTNRSLLEALRNVNDPLRCPGNLLPALSQQLGVNYEPDMGMNQMRKLLSTIVHQYKIKGTTAGITGISTAVTGWASQLSVGTNLLLSAVTPFYMESAGVRTYRQTAVVRIAGTSTHNNQTGVVNISVASGAGYTVSGLPSTAFPADPSTTLTPLGDYPTAWPAALASLTQTMTASVFYGTPIMTAPFWSVQPSGSYIAPMNGVAIAAGTVAGYGIPVAGLPTVSFSTYFWIQGFSTAFTLQPVVSFYNAAQVLLGTVNTATVALTQGGWTLVAASGVAVPVGAIWAVLSYVPTTSISFVTNTSVAVMAAPYFGAAPAAPYQEPRTLNISLLADRVNYMVNPGFEGQVGVATGTATSLTPTASSYTSVAALTSGFAPDDVVLARTSGGTTAYWTATTNCAIVASQAYTFPVPNAPAAGSWSCQVTAIAAGAMTVTSSLMAINPEFLFTASLYAQPATTVQQVTAALLFYDANGNLLDTFTGAALTEYIGQWVRPYAQVDPNAVLPPAAVQAAVQVTWAGCAAGEVHYFDAVLFEPVWALRPYFDAGLYNVALPPHAASDYLWAGSASVTMRSGATSTAFIGPSYYYATYRRKMTRLGAVLTGTAAQVNGQTSPLSVTGFLPAGAAYTLVTPASV